MFLVFFFFLVYNYLVVVYNLQNDDGGGKWFGVVGFWGRVGMWVAYAVFFLEILSIFGNIPHFLHKNLWIMYITP